MLLLRMGYPTISLREFNALDLEERAMFLCDDGSFVSVDPDGPSNFYALGDFYVEARAAKDASRVIAITSFRDGERYERMVACIDLARL